ncbi:MAG: hypothetical protein INQ03_24035 [Candidatus Heimdallarchaeota archaeon]|nr:hypothetical protein [Candidatus Heimdallarchaeota archaeon]
MTLRSVILQTPQGIPVFGRSLACTIGLYCTDLSQDSAFDDQTVLLSGLLTAMLVVEDSALNEFHEFNLEKTKLLSYPTEDVIAVFELIDDGEDDDTLKNRLRLMVELFEEEYREELSRFKGNIQPFSKFDKTIEAKGLLDSSEKFKANCINCKYSKHCTFRMTTGPKFPTIKEKIDSIVPSSRWMKAFWVFLSTFGYKFR